MKYTNEYNVEAIDEYKALVESDPISRYAIKVGEEMAEDFNTPPLMKMVNFMTNIGDVSIQEEITRHCILKKKVTVLLDGEAVGSFQMNNLNDLWEAFDVLKAHPGAFSLILNLCQSFVIKKYSLPPINTPDRAAAGGKTN